MLFALHSHPSPSCGTERREGQNETSEGGLFIYCEGTCPLHLLARVQGGDAGLGFWTQKHKRVP